MLVRVALGNAALATALAVLVALAAWACRRRPALVHHLWLLVLLKLVTPPLWTVPISWPERKLPLMAADPAPRLKPESIDAPPELELLPIEALSPGPIPGPPAESTAMTAPPPEPAPDPSPTRPLQARAA